MYVEELCLATVNKMINDNFIILKGRLKPRLSEKQKMKGLEIVLVEVGNDLKCRIYIDEKWLYLHHDGTLLGYLPRQEDLFKQSIEQVQSKSNITKVMFLVAITPQQDK
jgi:hypothetical protein